MLPERATLSEAPEISGPATALLHWPLAVMGAGALVSAGVVVTLRNQSSGPLSVLIIVGGMLLLLAFFVDDLA